jgi:hypothetical protein
VERREETPVADATVFIDDAVLRNLPDICVIDGITTADRLTFRQQVSGSAELGVAWLLILFGPLGWLGLAAIALFRQRAEYLTVTLPYSENVQLRRVQAERSRLKATVAVLAAFVLALIALVQHSSGYDLLALGLAAFGVGALISLVVLATRVHHLSVQLRLDASRRWLTLCGVHPEFALAVEYRTTRLSEQSKG